VSTNLRSTHAFHLHLLTEASCLHTPKSVKEAAMQADNRAYPTPEALDTHDDPKLARRQAETVNQLLEWLAERLLDTPVWSGEREVMLPAERFTRENSKRNWKHAAEKMRL